MSRSDEDASNFVAITGCQDEGGAMRWLELTGGDLQAAVALYMESNEGGGGGAAARAPGEGELDVDEDGVRRPDSTKRQRLIDTPTAGNMRGPAVNPFRDFGAETRGAFGQGGSPWDARE